MSYRFLGWLLWLLAIWHGAKFVIEHRRSKVYPDPPRYVYNGYPYRKVS